MRTVEEIKKDIEKIENRIFMEHMADILDWSNYFRLNHALFILKKELKSVEQAVQ